MSDPTCSNGDLPVEGFADVEALIRRDEELAREGWERRFVAAPPRLQEVVALYESLGFEVLQEAIAPAELPAPCDGCLVALALSRAIYTRKTP
jgi:hypothetical protein